MRQVANDDVVHAHPGGVARLKEPVTQALGQEKSNMRVAQFGFWWGGLFRKEMFLRHDWFSIGIRRARQAMHVWSRHAMEPAVTSGFMRPGNRP